MRIMKTTQELLEEISYLEMKNHRLYNLIIDYQQVILELNKKIAQLEREKKNDMSL